jgi:hypothetical protein
LNVYNERRAKRKRNQEFIHRQAQLLSARYDAWEKLKVSHEDRVEKKQKVMEGIKEEFLVFSGRDTWPESWELNNTFFTDYLNYHASNDSLKLVINDEFQGDIKAFVESIK